jgi:hypothetical protein
MEMTKWVHYGNGEVTTEEYIADGQCAVDHICNCEVVNGVSVNAQLISAAPELLAELIKARKIIEESDEWWMDSQDRGGFDTESMDAAINKALGK